MKPEIILIAHNVRSCHNVGSLLRTAEGLGVKKVYLTGYTPYPQTKSDKRLPHVRLKIDKQIQKTSLGAENYVAWKHFDDIYILLKSLKKRHYDLVALEQTPTSLDLDKFTVKAKTALIVGREVEGIELEILDLVDSTVSIPMLGKKESFNVVQAAAMALYKFRYFNR